MCSKELVIFGSGGHAVSVASVARSAGYNVKFFLDSNSQLSSLLGVSIVKKISLIDNYVNFSYAIGIGDNYKRRCLVLSLEKDFPPLTFPQLIHRSATISEGCNVGRGTLVMPGVVIGPLSNVGEYCILNTNSSIDHECVMQDFSSLAPGVSTGGRVSIGEGSAISIGAKIKHGVSIGRDTIVGANSYVDRNISALQVVYGTPAHVVRSRDVGDSYLH